MTVALVRSLWFSLSVFVLVALWEVLTFQLPREPHIEVWKRQLAVHLLLVVAIALGALFGGLFGFYFLPTGHSFTLWRLATLGGLLAAVTFFTVAPFARVGG